MSKTILDRNNYFSYRAGKYQPAGTNVTNVLMKKLKH